MTSPPTIRADLDRIRQLEYLTVRECSLLVNCSRPTIRRRLPRLGDAVLRDGGIIRVRRVALLRLFHRDAVCRARDAKGVMPSESAELSTAGLAVNGGVTHPPDNTSDKERA